MTTKEFAFKNIRQLIMSKLNIVGTIEGEHVLYPAWVSGGTRVADWINSLTEFNSGPWAAVEDLENDCVYVISTQF